MRTAEQGAGLTVPPHIPTCRMRRQCQSASRWQQHPKAEDTLSTPCLSSSAPSRVSHRVLGEDLGVQGSPTLTLTQDPLTSLPPPAEPSSFQLRCYLFQALELKPHGTRTTAGGTTQHPDPPQQHPWVLTAGAAPTDPVAHVSFVHVSQSTRVLPGTLDPVWDQALLFHRVPLYGDPRGVRDEPPAVVVEVFDQDGGVQWGYTWLGSTYRQWAPMEGGHPCSAAALQGAGSFLGRCVCTPKVWLDVGRQKPPRLQRYPLEGPGGPAGELLAAFELLHEAEVRGGWQGGAWGLPEPVPSIHVPVTPIGWGGGTAQHPSMETGHLQHPPGHPAGPAADGTGGDAGDTGGREEKG